ncbi:ryncolin-2-like [Drosophila guanche]|uniref:Blast:Tenascin n=2 Tax=Drosophila guanche TaxID=7266 RepID=A0A3B0JHK1_DROGU|nr:ryncolin-2-like [Drosophila guanche]SPP81884.1 blast:Tenascin [Drosophila guanche]
MLHFGLLLSVVLFSIFSRLSAEKACEMSTICGNAASIRSQMIAVRVEQERHGELLDELSQKLDTCLSKTGVETKMYGKSCAEPSILTQHSEINVIVVPEYSKHPFVVACDQLSHGGGWTIVLRRTDGSEDFYRDWNDYKNGFGKLENEFFLGLDKLHAMSSAQGQELLVLLEDNGGERRYQMYDNFKIGSEQDGFALESLGNTSGNAGDALATHLGQKFTTRDRDNDKHAASNCAVTYSSAWWYNACHHSNLAGKYGDNTHGKGINWYQFKGHTYSLKRAQMMIRPRKQCH